MFPILQTTLCDSIASCHYLFYFTSSCFTRDVIISIEKNYIYPAMNYAALASILNIAALLGYTFTFCGLS